MIKMTKGKYFLIIATFATFYSYFCHSQNVQGNIQLNSNWEDTIYFQPIKNYHSILNGNFSNSFAVPIAKNGYFKSPELLPNTLYRLLVFHKSGDHSFIQNGYSDNYAFIITGSDSHSISFSANIDTFFISYKAQSNDNKVMHVLRQIDTLRNLQIPMDLALQETTSKFQEMQKNKIINSNIKNELRLNLQNTKKQVNRNTLQYVRTLKKPLVISLGIVFAGFDYENHSEEIISTINRLLTKHAYNPVAQSILEKCQTIAKPVDTSIFYQNFTCTNGAKIQLANIKSKYILFDFWASWCVPCRKAIKEEMTPLSNKYSDSLLTIIGIISSDKLTTAKKAIKNDNNPFLQIFDSTGHINSMFHVEVLPTYYLLNTHTKNIIKIYSFESLLDCLSNTTSN